MSRETQVRIYTIHEGKMDLWLEGWRSGVKPLREQYGFEIPHAWVVPEENKFVWLLTYDGPGTFAEQNAIYWASEDRKTLNPDPAQYVTLAEKWFATPFIGD